MKRVQKLADGETGDPLGRMVEHGFAVIVRDNSGRDIAWANQVFDTEHAANITAARCVPAAHDIRPARRISYFSGKPGRLSKPRSTVIID